MNSRDHVFSTYTNHIVGNSNSLPLVQMGSHPSSIRPTNLLFYTRFKFTFLPCNSVSLPLVQLGGEQYPLDQPVNYFISTLKLRFCPPVKKYGFASTSK
ncbi:hypothetical protein Hanom_Chr07g00677691 [Helianthus anomalus]